MEYVLNNIKDTFGNSYHGYIHRDRDDPGKLYCLQAFWKLYHANKEKGILAFRGIKKFNLFGMLSLFLIILTGIALLWIVEWTFTQLIWFQIKLGLVFLLFLNGFTLGRINNEKLNNYISEQTPIVNLPDDIAKLKRNLAIFQGGQLCIFFLIIIIATFKFS